MLVRPGPTILRATSSGLVAPAIASPIVTSQPESCGSTLVSRGRSSFRRTTCASSSRARAALRMVLLWSLPSTPTSSAALVSNTSHSVSARWNTAAGVGAANGKNSRRLSPCRRSSAITGRLGSRCGARRARRLGLLGRSGRRPASSAATLGMAAAGGAVVGATPDQICDLHSGFGSRLGRPATGSSGRGNAAERPGRNSSGCCLGVDRADVDDVVRNPRGRCGYRPVAKT